MPSVLNVPIGSRRLLRTALVAAALSACTVLPATVAAAGEPAGTTVVGELVQAWPETDPSHVAAGRAAEGPITWIQPADGDAVRVETDGVSGIPVGSTVSITLGPTDGDDEGDGQDVEDVDLVAPVITPPVLADPTGLTNQVTVVLVRPAGAAPDGVTEAQVVDAVDGPVADFWSEQTDGAVRVGVTESYDWTVTTADCSDARNLWNEVASSVGFAGGPRQHLLLYISGSAPGCSYALAEVGAQPGAGGRLYVTDVRPSAIAHELGHNFGLGHSSGQQCDAGPEAGSCRTVGYRDYYDVMGASWTQLGSLNAPQAAALNVLPAAQQLALAVGGSPATVTLAPLSGRTGTRAVRLTDAGGVQYWLEYRTPTARDAWLGTPDNSYRLQDGVLLRRVGAMPDTSVLLDGTPGPAAGWGRDFQAALPLGTPIPVSSGSFTVVVQSVSSAGAVLSVTPAAGTAAAPATRAAAPARGVMSGDATGTTVPSAATPSAGYWTPETDGLTSVRPNPALAAAADSTTGLSGFLVAAAGSLLAGATMLLVRWRRRVVYLRR